MKEYHLLKKNSFSGDIDIHSDLFSVMPSALSRKRALKAGREEQAEMEDKEKGPEECILCYPTQKSPGSFPYEVVIQNRVADFLHDFPYMPGDQRFVFLWHTDSRVRENHLHRFKLKDLRRTELFWLLYGCIKRGNQYRTVYEDRLKRSTDLMRMVVGFNLGKLAGQSIPHIHAQYGWEVVLNPRSISQNELNLYLEELKDAELVIYKDERIMVVAPWTPMGQFALDLYFVNKYNIYELDYEDCKVFATVSHAIIQKYLNLGIQNLNIVFTNSPHNKQSEPLIAHFVPRVNMTALYEIKGVNVVDTLPSKIAEEFRGYARSGTEEINWPELLEEADDYDPDEEFLSEINQDNRIDTVTFKLAGKQIAYASPGSTVAEGLAATIHATHQLIESFILLPLKWKDKKLDLEHKKVMQKIEQVHKVQELQQREIERAQKVLKFVKEQHELRKELGLTKEQFDNSLVEPLAQNLSTISYLIEDKKLLLSAQEDKELPPPEL